MDSSWNECQSPHATICEVHIQGGISATGATFPSWWNMPLGSKLPYLLVTDSLRSEEVTSHIKWKEALAVSERQKQAYSNALHEFFQFRVLFNKCKTLVHFSLRESRLFPLGF
jgi:hypothetical protein